jgi:antiviral helicase SKI2
MLNFERSKLTAKLDHLKFATSNSALILSEEYRQRLHFLRTLDYIDKDNLIGLKGKVACEISHLEVLIVELLFENKFDGKSCAELAAMLSPMTCQFTFAGNKEVDQVMDFKHSINLIVSFGTFFEN